MLMGLLLICFFEWFFLFLKYFATSAIVKQSTIKIMAEALIFENEKGMF